MDGVTAVREALGRIRSGTGGALLVAFTALGVATVVAHQTLTAAYLDRFGDVLVTALEGPLAGGDAGAFLDGLQPAPLSLGLPYEVAAVLFAATAVCNEYLTIVTLRTVAGERLAAAATRRIGRAVLYGTLVGVVVRTLVLVGLVAFVLPGLFLAVSLLFAHARVAIEDEGPLTALRGAWVLATGRRAAVFSVVTLLAALYLAPMAVGGMIEGETVGLLVGGVIAGPVALLSSATVARAYVGFTDDSAEVEDPYAQPLGPDDLPEP
jgi:hypothetical protein